MTEVTIKWLAEVTITGEPVTYMQELQGVTCLDEATAQAQTIAAEGLTVNLPNSLSRGRLVYGAHRIHTVAVYEEVTARRD